MKEGRSLQIWAWAGLTAFLLLPAGIRAQKSETLRGYAEYRQGSVLVVEGQKVVADRNTRYKGKGVYSINTIPLGYEVEVKGKRRADGTMLASRIEGRPNGIAMFEPQVLEATNEIEKIWTKEGKMFTQNAEGKRVDIGRIEEKGADAERVRKIMDRLLPPYLDRKRVRVRVVDTKEWNASAMGNGAIWVYKGLIRESTDDELAIVLGHELAHFTHEHTRRGAKSQIWAQVLGAAAAVGGEAVGGVGGQAVGIGGLLGATAFQSGYSRDMEDQADRVGLRYAYEGGYDVRAGPRLWEKFRKKYGENDAVSNFFVGSHSRPTDRIRNINRELEMNYSTQAQ